MKAAILIMSTLQEPSARNIQVMKETFVSETVNLMKKHKLKNSYDFYFYQAVEDLDTDIKKYELSEHVYNIDIKMHETVYRTYEKTYLTYKTFNDKEYDWYIRINISMFLNIRLLDTVLKTLDKKTVYCNALNTYVNVESAYLNKIYPRGDFYMICDDYRKGILSNGEQFMYSDTFDRERENVPHVDDTLTGCALIQYLGQRSHNHFKLIHYNFIPGPNIEDINKMAIGSRVKTVPPGQLSGYSWDDNDYRLKDVDKMYELQKFYEENDKDLNKLYYNISEKNLLVPKENSRPTLFVQTVNANPEDIKIYWNSFWDNYYLRLKSNQN